MMLDRTKFPFLTDKFFTAIKPSTEIEKIKSEIPVPSSQHDEDLKKFLESEGGSISRKKGSNLIDALDVWRKQHKILHEKAAVAIKALKEAFDFKFSESSVENGETYALCTDGMVNLAEIIFLIQRDEDPLSREITTEKINNLLENIFKEICDGGINRHLYDARNELRNDAGSQLMVVREKQCHYILIEFIQKFNANDVGFLVTEGDEIHYVTYVLNQFANSFGLNQVAETRITDSGLYEVQKLIKAFPEKIYASLSLEYVLQTLVDKINPFSIVRQIEILNGVIKETKTNENITPGKKLTQLNENFVRSIKNFGYFNFQINDIFDQDALMDGQFQLSVDLPAYTFIMLFLGLGKLGFVDLSLMQKITLTDKVQLNFIPTLNLKFAYISDNEEIKPFIPYSLDQWRKGDFSLLSTFKDYPDYLRELCFHLCEYLKKPERNLEYIKLFDHPKMSQLFNTYCNQVDLIDLALSLPEEQRNHLFKALQITDETFVQFLQPPVGHPELLGKIIQLFEKEKWLAFLGSIGKSTLLLLLQESKLLIAFKQLPEAKRLDFLESIICNLKGEELSLVLPADIFIQVMNNSLKKSKLSDQLIKYLHLCIQSKENLKYFLQGLNFNGCIIFFTNFNKNLLTTYIKTFEELLGVLILQDHPRKFLSETSILVLINFMQQDYLRGLINSTQKLGILLQLPLGASKFIFNSLGSEHLEKCIGNYNNLLKTIIFNLDAVDQNLNALHTVQIKNLLESVSKNFLLRLFGNTNSFTNILKSRKYRRLAAILLSILGEEGLQKIIPDMKALKAVAQKWKRNVELHTFEIFKLINSAYLFKLVNNNLESALKELTKECRIHFVENLNNDHLNLLIVDHQNFLKILQLLDREDNIKFYLKLGQVKLQSLISNPDDLINVLKNVETGKRPLALEKLIEVLGRQHLSQILPLNDVARVTQLISLTHLRRGYTAILNKIIQENVNSNPNPSKRESDNTYSPRIFKKKKSEEIKEGKMEEERAPMERKDKTRP